MNVQHKQYTTKKLVEAFVNGSLVRNKEYQRGEAWSELQKAGFIDSLFRSYPVPALFLYQIKAPGLDDAPVSRYEIVDGQQRLTALRDFADGGLRLQNVGEKSRLRLPRTVASKDAPWAGRYIEELSVELRKQFEETEITVFLIDSATDADEIRDLFIRLQSGTALSRQQIRDAWPGALGPFVERLAGKLDRSPSLELFDLIDKRGQRNEDEGARDQHVADRQLCAQLLRVFVSRDRDPYAYPSVSAADLDSLYHEFTDFDADGTTAQRFMDCAKRAAEVFRKAWVIRLNTKNKFKRLDVTAVMMFLQDMSRSALYKLDSGALAARIAESESKNPPRGKSTSGATLEAFYNWWRENVALDVGIRLDEKRAFDADQRHEVRERDKGMCSVCGEAVADADSEFDHWPVPWRDGGRTVPENGRLVHRDCHPRGRPTISAG